MSIGKELESKEENAAPENKWPEEKKPKEMIKWCIFIMVKG